MLCMVAAAAAAVPAWGQSVAPPPPPVTVASLGAEQGAEAVRGYLDERKAAAEAAGVGTGEEEERVALGLAARIMVMSGPGGATPGNPCAEARRVYVPVYPWPSASRSLSPVLVLALVLVPSLLSPSSHLSPLSSHLSRLSPLSPLLSRFSRLPFPRPRPGHCPRMYPFLSVAVAVLVPVSY